MSDNYYVLMSEAIYHDDVELIKYYSRKLASFCKAHRCATCPFYIDDKCTFVKDSPDNWRGIEDNKDGAGCELFKEDKTNENND